MITDTAIRCPWVTADGSKFAI